MPSMSSMSCVHMNIGPTLPHPCFYILYSCSVQTTVTFEMAEVFQFLGQDSVYQSGFICVMCSYLLSICRITNMIHNFWSTVLFKNPNFSSPVTVKWYMIHTHVFLQDPCSSAESYCGVQLALSLASNNGPRAGMHAFSGMFPTVV